MEAGSLRSQEGTSHKRQHLPSGTMSMTTPHGGRSATKLQPLRTRYGCTAQRVMQLPDNANALFVTHDFPTAEQAGGFAHDLALRAGMQQAGVQGAPRIEIYTDV